MVKDKRSKMVQVNDIFQYTVTGSGPQEKEPETNVTQGAVDHSQGTAETLGLIQGSRKALDHKMDAMSMDINYLRLNLRIVVERVTTTKEDVASLNLEMHVEECAEVAEGRSRHNNVLFIFSPEKVEGPFTELYL
ncbi:hypothetical protein NDU88_007052 [Pleurodeles waltl]|uniref:Uncharacterized protein n=1 Tax=Pleurodeles waltl TaxID=8319 RepID=A0AAV7UQT9_PLEWA|nr:hypothetical protein NDU88_007052 [Pleurodeles waltl]